jgi:hypothetical protein
MDVGGSASDSAQPSPHDARPHDASRGPHDTSRGAAHAHALTHAPAVVSARGACSQLSADDGGGAAARKERQLRALNAEVSVLKTQLAAEREQYQRERDEWRHREGSLTTELSAARRLSGYRQHVLEGNALAELRVGREELERIEADVRQQETLIAGYQKENERLSEQLKGVKEAQRAEASKSDDEARRLALRLAELERTHVERAPDGLRDQIERSHLQQAELREASAERCARARPCGGGGGGGGGGVCGRVWPWHVCVAVARVWHVCGRGTCTCTPWRVFCRACV